MLSIPNMHTTPRPQAKLAARFDAYALLMSPNAHAGLLLLFIAGSLIALPEIPERTKSVLLVAFACVAMIRRS
jgi:hypothetical protein